MGARDLLRVVVRIFDRNITHATILFAGDELVAVIGVEKKVMRLAQLIVELLILRCVQHTHPNFQLYTHCRTIPFRFRFSSEK